MATVLCFTLGCTETTVLPAATNATHPTFPGQSRTGDTLVIEDAHADVESGLLDSQGSDSPNTSEVLKDVKPDASADLSAPDSTAPPDATEDTALAFDASGIEEIWDQAPSDDTCSEDTSLALYTDLIEPILAEENAQSCNQCHLSGMNLSMYAQGNACDTMSCMLAAGLVDFADPKESKVLKQILKAEPDSPLITETVIENEYEAFLQWITHSASCHASECPKPAEFCSGEPNQPDDYSGPSPLGSCSETEAVNAFTNYVMKWKGRCHGCHTNCDEEFDAPCWLVYDYDKDNPAEVFNASMLSMYNLIGIDAIDVASPYQSTMLLKPLKAEYGGMNHGGGDKFADLADEAYQDYILWLDYYKNCYDNTKPSKPIVSLFTPNKYEKKYPLGSPATLHGFAEDPIEGVLSGASLVWTTDALDDPVGFGTGPLQVVLPLGKQIITLTATNTKGLAGTRAFKVYVKE